jgi:hypothetical protein
MTTETSNLFIVIETGIIPVCAVIALVRKFWTLLEESWNFEGKWTNRQKEQNQAR